MESIKLSERITSIGYGAFRCCSSLSSIKLPVNLKTISIRAFESCSSLISIQIPENVTSIDTGAFFDCSSLSSFICLATNPPLFNGIFQYYNGEGVFNGTIYVPTASVETYKATDGWKEYADRIRPIAE